MSTAPWISIDGMASRCSDGLRSRYISAISAKCDMLLSAAGFIRFAERVFGAEEIVSARTPTPSGELIHA